MPSQVPEQTESAPLQTERAPEHFERAQKQVEKLVKELPSDNKIALTVETQTSKPAVALKADSALHAEHKEARVPALTPELPPALPRALINARTTTNAKQHTTKRRT